MPASKDVPVRITQDATLEGDEPIVFLGPNGAGKTRHAVDLASWNSVELIPALRAIALGERVPMKPTGQAADELRANLEQRPWWQPSNEINLLFAKLLADDSEAAVRFRNTYLAGTAEGPEVTKLVLVKEVWSRLFPGRRLDFTSHEPRVASDYSGAGVEYPAQQMSDGERVALYLVARVLNSDSKIIVVDEPEAHFHSRLAVLFWDELERMRPDCRFVYMTHDVPFGLSRPGARFVILMPNNPPNVVEADQSVPSEVMEAILAAASFSIHARRIVFCEGSEKDSLDMRLYSAWFNGPETVVVPVGSCRDVVLCARAFSESKLISGVRAIGIIDQDYAPAEVLSKLPPSVHSLSCHEVENLLCSRGVSIALAEHFGADSAAADEKHAQFLRRAAAVFKDRVLNKQISERFRRRLERSILGALSTLEIDDSLAEMERKHINALDSGAWMPSTADVFHEEQAALQHALDDPGEEFVRIFPGKMLLGHAAETHGMTRQAFVELVCNALSAEPGAPLAGLGTKLSAILSTGLPPRSVDVNESL